MAEITPEEVPTRLAALRNRAGLSMKALAVALGYAGGSSWQKYESADRPMYIGNDLAAKLEQILRGRGVPPISSEEIWALTGIDQSVRRSGGGPGRSPRLVVAGTNLRPYAQRDLPILGHGRGGEDGLFFDNGAGALAYTYRPVELLNVENAYAVYVNGDSMTPRFKHGEMVYVDPNRPPAPGDDIVIQLANGEGYIKELVRRTARVIICKEYRPDEREIEFPTDQVRSLHQIIASTKVRV